MIKIKETKLYKEIKNNKKDVVTAIPFKYDTNITITTSNIKYIIESEIIQYNTKIKILKDMNIDYPIDNNFEKKITKELTDRIGLNKLDIKFIYVNYNNIDDAISLVENTKEFVDWCIN